jgi:hypothetical protein
MSDHFTVQDPNKRMGHGKMDLQVGDSLRGVQRKIVRAI